MNNPIQIALIDDHQMFREGLKALLNGFDDCQVVFELSNGAKLTEELATRQVDIICMDLDMPVMNGFQTLEKLSLSGIDAKVIFISQNNEPSMIARLMELGARGYLLKDSSAEMLHSAIQSVYQNGYFFNDLVSGSLLQKMAKSSAINPTYKNDELSSREIEVLKMICDELTSAEIADKMSLSIKTIENHRSNLMSKTGAKNLAGLVVYAVKNRLYNVR
ncbi:MAG: response regulator transcription factor [Bacteroidetes bacterium]|nr:response regulator transcription factor [Bacteroidota bacterium]